MKSEASANQSLAASTEQDRIDEQQYQAGQANKAHRQRTSIDSNWFWVRAMKFLTAVTVLAVAYRLIVIYFLG